MTSRRLVEFCACGEPLNPDNRTGRCAECRWEARNRRLLDAERRHQEQRRRQAVAERLAELDKTAPQSTPDRAGRENRADGA